MLTKITFGLMMIYSSVLASFLLFTTKVWGDSGEWGIIYSIISLVVGAIALAEPQGKGIAIDALKSENGTLKETIREYDRKHDWHRDYLEAQNRELEEQVRALRNRLPNAGA